MLNKPSCSFFFILLLGLFFSCEPLFAQVEKRPLKFSIVTNGYTKKLYNIRPIAEHLSKLLNRPVEVVESFSNPALVEALQKKEIDIAIVNSFGYVLAKPMVDINPLVALGKKDGSPSTYQSCLISHPSSGIDTLSILKGQIDELSLIFVNKTSTSGHLLPRFFFNSHQINPEKRFKRVIYGESHSNTIQSIKLGDADIGACAYGYVQEKIESGEIILGENLNIIWKSEPIVDGPIIVRADLDKALQQKIQTIFLDIPSEAPELWKHIQENWTFPSDNYVPISDRDYDSIRNVNLRLEDLHGILATYKKIKTH